MNRLPNSERFWIYAVCAFSAAVVLFSSVATYRAITGKEEPPPAYQSAAPPSLVKHPEEEIADLDNAQRPPISDEDFLFLHSMSRQMANRMIKPGFDKWARQWVTEDAVLDQAREARRSYASAWRKARTAGAADASVRRPVGNRSEVTTSLNLVGDDASAATLSLSVFWVKSAQGWRCYGLVPTYASDYEEGEVDGVDGAERATSDDTAPEEEESYNPDAPSEVPSLEEELAAEDESDPSAP